MSYFPFFVDIAGKRGVIIGGGKHAAFKVEKLLPFGADLVVIAPEPEERMEALVREAAQGAGAFCNDAGASVECTSRRLVQGGSVTLLRRNWMESDLEGAEFVITALDDAAENTRISQWCRARRILINAVDQPADCGFYFPSIVKDGPMTVAISSDGKSPAATVLMRKKVESVMPEGIGAAVELLGQLRPEVMERVPDFKTRTRLLEELLAFCLEKGGAVTLDELRARMEADGWKK